VDFDTDPKSATAVLIVTVVLSSCVMKRSQRHFVPWKQASKQTPTTNWPASLLRFNNTWHPLTHASSSCLKMITEVHPTHLHHHHRILTSLRSWGISESTFLISTTRELKTGFTKSISCSLCTSCPLNLASPWCRSIWKAKHLLGSNGWRKEAHPVTGTVSFMRFKSGLVHQSMMIHWAASLNWYKPTQWLVFDLSLKRWWHEPLVLVMVCSRVSSTRIKTWNSLGIASLPTDEFSWRDGTGSTIWGSKWRF